MAQQPVKPTITGKMLAAVKKNPQTQYGTLVPIARNLQTGRLDAAMPDVVRTPLESLLNVLQAFEQPQQATERIVPDMLNIFMAGKTGTAATKVRLPTMRYKGNDPEGAVGLGKALRVLTNDPSSGGVELYWDAWKQIISDFAKSLPQPKISSREVNLPIEPKERKGINIRIEPRKDAK